MRSIPDEPAKRLPEVRIIDPGIREKQAPYNVKEENDKDMSKDPKD